MLGLGVGTWGILNTQHPEFHYSMRNWEVNWRILNSWHLQCCNYMGICLEFERAYGGFCISHTQNAIIQCQTGGHLEESKFLTPGMLWFHGNLQGIWEGEWRKLISGHPEDNYSMGNWEESWRISNSQSPELYNSMILLGIWEGSRKNLNSWNLECHYSLGMCWECGTGYEGF